MPEKLRHPAAGIGIAKRQQATWSSGDYAAIGATLQIVGETLAAARRFAQVTSTDYVRSLLDKGAQRAAADGFDVAFEVADAENLPYADGTFDVVLSTFGAMFTPDHTRPAHEMLRVLRSGGRVGLANWTPEGFIGQLFRIVGSYVPPPSGLKSPALWGTEPHIVELFGTQAADIRTERRIFNFRYRSAEHWVDVFRRFYGPVHKAFARLDATAQAGLDRDIRALLERLDTGGARSLVVPGEYLQVVIVKH
jgi:SAM-dependent methyltransferase